MIFRYPRMFGNKKGVYGNIPRKRLPSHLTYRRGHERN